MVNSLSPLAISVTQRGIYYVPRSVLALKCNALAMASRRLSSWEDSHTLIKQLRNRAEQGEIRDQK